MSAEPEHGELLAPAHAHQLRGREHRGAVGTERRQADERLLQHQRGAVVGRRIPVLPAEIDDAVEKGGAGLREHPLCRCAQIRKISGFLLRFQQRPDRKDQQCRDERFIDHAGGQQKQAAQDRMPLFAAFQPLSEEVQREQQQADRQLMTERIGDQQIVIRIDAEPSGAEHHAQRGKFPADLRSQQQIQRGEIKNQRAVLHELIKPYLVQQKRKAEQKMIP